MEGDGDQVGELNIADSNAYFHLDILTRSNSFLHKKLFERLPYRLY